MQHSLAPVRRELEHRAAFITVTEEAAVLIASRFRRPVEVALLVQNQTCQRVGCVALSGERVEDGFRTVGCQSEDRAASNLTMRATSATACRSIKIARFVRDQTRIRISAVCAALESIQHGFVTIRRDLENGATPQRL